MYTTQTTGTVQEMPFSVFLRAYMMKTQKFPYHENYISY